MRDWLLQLLSHKSSVVGWAMAIVKYHEGHSRAAGPIRRRSRVPVESSLFPPTCFIVVRYRPTVSSVAQLAGRKFRSQVAKLLQRPSFVDTT